MGQERGQPCPRVGRIRWFARTGLSALLFAQRCFPKPSSMPHPPLWLPPQSQAFYNDERKDELLVFRRLLRTANGTRGIPNPEFEQFVGGVRHTLKCMRSVRGKIISVKCPLASFRRPHAQTADRGLG